ncbi:MAG: B12-binding domain-containing radical SAM protein, partial [Candidatus Omnitrophota bacterium]
MLGEAEVTLPIFFEDIKKGKPRHIYQANLFAGMSKTPIPKWDLIYLQNYSGASVQYSRGCPYECEFCEVIIRDGRVPRT